MTAPTFTRNSVAYKSDGTQVASGVPRFESTGLTIEEGTTNLIPTLNATNYTGASCTVTNSTVYQPYGIAGLRGVNNNGTNLSIFQQANFENVTSGISYTLWAKFKTGTVQAGTQMRIVAWRSDYSSLITTSLTSVSSNTEYYWVVSGQFTTSGQAFVSVDITVPSGNTTDTVYVGAIQIEQKAYATSFIDPGATRAAESLTIPTSGVLSASQGTIEMDYNVLATGTEARDTTNTHYLFAVGGTGYITIARTAAGNIVATTNNGTSSSTITVADSFTAGEHRIGFTYTSTGNALYFDGTSVGTAPTPYLPSVLAANAYLGSYSDGTQQLNTQTTDFMLSSVARTASQMTTRGGV